MLNAKNETGSDSKNVASIAARLSQIFASAFPLLPGLTLAAALAGVAFWLSRLSMFSGVSPLIIGTVLGMILGNLGAIPGWARPGLIFAMRRLLRLGIVLLGLQLTLGQVLSVGLSGLLVIVIALVATFLFTQAVGRAIGVDRKLTELIAAGTAVCGASAVIATNEVTGGTDEDVAYAVAAVTFFGSISMLAFPMIAALLQMDVHAYGLWVGASVHEVAQVVAAAYQYDVAAGEAATVAKLSRVLLLAPLVMILGIFAARRCRDDGAEAHPPAVPYFVFGFIIMVLIASIGVMPSSMLVRAGLVSQLLLTAALAALGTETSFRKLRKKGIRPLLLGAVATLFIGVLAFMLVYL